MCVGSPTQEKMWIDGCEMKQGSATGTSKVTAGSSQKQITKRQLSRGAGRGANYIKGKALPFSNSTEFGNAVVFATSRQAVRVNH